MNHAFQGIGPSVISLRSATKRFGDHVVVENLSLEIGQGEIVALLGRTGAGKSTVMNLLMGTLAADEGHVEVAGIEPANDFEALRGKLAVSFQTDRLLPWRTARGNVELALRILDKSPSEATSIADQWLGRVGLSGAALKYPGELSGGMRQRVSLARALAVDPTIVLLDESFSQLDQVTSRELRTDFRTIVRRYNKTCVFVTHRIDDALEMADRIIVLSVPAKVALELRLDDESRASPAVLRNMTAAIEKAIGGAPGRKADEHNRT